MLTPINRTKRNKWPNATSDRLLLSFARCVSVSRFSIQFGSPTCIVHGVSMCVCFSLSSSGTTTIHHHPYQMPFIPWLRSKSNLTNASSAYIHTHAAQNGMMVGMAVQLTIEPNATEYGNRQSVLLRRVAVCMRFDAHKKLQTRTLAQSVAAINHVVRRIICMQAAGIRHGAPSM